MKNRMSYLFSILFVLFFAGTIVGVFHVSGQLFGAEKAISNKDIVSVVKSDVKSFWQQTWDSVCAAFDDVIRQAIVNLHQTIALAIMFWLIGMSKKTWARFLPKLDGAIDTYFSSASLQTRQNMKNYINLLVSNSIDTVEASFMRVRANVTNDKADLQEAQDKQKKSKEKMASALTLIMEDLVNNGLRDIAYKNKTDREMLVELVDAIEKDLMKKRLEYPETVVPSDDVEKADEAKPPTSKEPQDASDVGSNVLVAHAPQFTLNAVWDTSARLKLAPEQQAVSANEQEHVHKITKTSEKIIGNAKNRLDAKYHSLIQDMMTEMAFGGVL